jgi:acetyl esterase/lipase
VDPGLRAAYVALPAREGPPPPAEEIAPAARAAFAEMMAPFNATPDGRVARRDAEADGVPLRIYEPRDRGAGDLLAAVLQIHGGAFILGTLDDYDFVCERLVVEQGVIVVSVGYRLAPEHVFPAQLDDCFVALRWLHASAVELGADPARIAVTGESAGACLAAGLALLARDRGGPPIAFQLLTCPALDDRMRTPSSLEITDPRVINRAATLSAWRAYLGREPGGDDTPAYAAPGRAPDVGGLPRTHIAVGQLDPMRDECVAFASRLMQAGVPTELHVWPGAYHGFEMVADAPISRDAKAARVNAWRRALA